MAALQLVLLVAIHSSTAAQAAASLRGVVLDEGGSPVEGAVVSVWLGREPVAWCRTGPDGRFDIGVEAGSRYMVYVFADDDATPGVDYLPARAEAAPDGGELRFILAPAASLVFEGDIQFVESEELPLSVVYVVLDPASSSAMKVRGFPLEYGKPGGQSTFIRLDPSHLVVPAGIPFSVLVNCSVLVGAAPIARSFVADEPGHFTLGRGERAVVDVRRYSLPFNIGVVEERRGAVESRIGEMESVGFYLAAERGKITSAVKLISEARYLYDEGRYIESFDAARKGYIALRHVLADLTGLYDDAALSVYILIFFLAFSSAAMAFLLSNRDSVKLVGGAAVYAVTLAVLYLTYPGSVIVPLGRFAASAAIALASSLTAA
ncbi:hypothetical protein DRO42_07910, partial [Candidatus Bathyarchaeota archaeon]